jgi:hypothetical protein
MISRHSRFVVLAFLAAGLGLMPMISPAQDKIPADIAGDYVIDSGGRAIPFKIVLQIDKVFFDALVPGGSLAPMTPVEGQALTFKSIDPKGDEIVLAFPKDDQGKIRSCMISIPSRGMEVKADKVEIK